MLFIRYINGSHIIWLRSASSNTQVIRNYGPQSQGTAGTLISWLRVPGMTQMGPQGFLGSGENGYLFSGIWGALAIILGELGSKLIILGI